MRGSMVVVKELAEKALAFKERGLSEREIADDLHRRHREDNLPERKGLRVLEAVECITGQEECENRVPGRFCMVQEVLGIQFHEEKLEAFLYP